MKRKQNEESIHELAGRLVEAKEKARQLGIFVDDRELLTCPECSLMEDVSVNGILLTCYPTNLGVDTGLRFIETDKVAHKFRCPACGIETTAQEAEL